MRDMLSFFRMYCNVVPPLSPIAPLIVVVIGFVMYAYLVIAAEEILLYVLSLLDTSDLNSSCLVSTVWRRLCEDEFMYLYCGRCAMLA
jgi:F-box-like